VSGTATVCLWPRVSEWPHPGACHQIEKVQLVPLVAGTCALLMDALTWAVKHLADSLNNLRNAR